MASNGIDHDESSRSISEDEAEYDFAQLQQRFQKIQRGSEAAEAQIQKDEKEHEAAVRRLEQRRDELKQSVKERDEASNDLRRQVHKLESANRAAQSERVRKEKALQQKDNQRRKRRDEAAKWEVQIATMAEEMNGIETQKKALQKRAESSIAETRQNIADEQKDMKSIEEDNRERSAQIRALEEERRRLNFEEETEESRETDRIEQEKDQQRRDTLYKLGINYASLTNALNHAKMEYDIVKDRLGFLQRVRNASYVYHPPPLDMDLARQSSKQRRPRQKSSLASNRSSPAHLANIDAFGSPRGYNSTNTSPTFGSGTAFFSSTNGMTLHGPPASNMAPEEVEALTGGGPMSPRADSLLPANLLGDESADDMLETDSISPHPSTDGARTRFNSIAHTTPEGLQDRASPQSSTSRSASVFTSPHQSMHELPDVDPDSSKSGGLDKSPNPQAPRNFVSGIFGFNRQRGKTGTEQAPVLGSLKSGESQSFPRNYGESLDPLARRRRSYAGNWAAPVTNLFPRNVANDKDGEISRLSSSRRGFPNLFSSTKNPTSSGYDQFGPRNDSQDFTPARSARDLSLSRPSSVYSFDRLPRPSTDSQPFGWGAPERSALRGGSRSDWAKWSQSPSRRASAAFGSNSNLSLQPAAEEVYEDAPPMPLQAPIGTRPSSSQQPKPILNPAAPSFTTLFARKDKGKDGKREGKEKEKGKDGKEKEQGKDGKEKEKAKDAKDKDAQKEKKEKEKRKEGKERKSKEGKDKDKSKEAKDEKKDKSKEPHIESELPPNGSPPVSRKSRDSRNAPSMSESRESLDRITTGTLSDTPPSKDATAKPTFIQKIARKSSSTKFNSWKDKGNIFSRKGEPSTPGEVDEDGEVQLGRSLESTSTTPSGDKEKVGRSSLSWAFMRKSKRGEKVDLTTSEVSESSERASDVGDDEGDRASLVA